MTLSLQHLSVTLGRRDAARDVVRDVSFSIDDGELVALLGPNGCGKTTLLRAALGLVPATGTIRWQDDETMVRDARKLSCYAAYLPQNPSSVPGASVSQVILAGRFVHRTGLSFLDTRHDGNAVARAAEAMGVGPFLDRPIDALSGGQRQRVYLARCLAQGSPTLLLDEPATFLDLRHQVELYQLLRRLVRDHGRTVLMACHDLNLAATHCDRMLLMQDGQLVADGPPDRVMDPALIERVYGVPMKRIDVDGSPHLVPAE
jgi:iron complex transport system ATP-binding protein